MKSNTTDHESQVKPLCSHCARPRWKLLLSCKTASCKFIYLNKSSVLRDHSEQVIRVKFKIQRNQQVQSRSMWWVRWKKYPQPIKPLGRSTAKQFHKIQWHRNNLKCANKRLQISYLKFSYKVVMVSKPSLSLKIYHLLPNFNLFITHAIFILKRKPDHFLKFINYLSFFPLNKTLLRLLNKEKLVFAPLL